MLRSHPDYPSLLSISDCLTKLKVINKAYKIEKSEYDPTELIFPFLASVNDSKRKFILVHSIKNGQVYYQDDIVHANVPESNFLKIWDGVVLHAKGDIGSGEANYWDNRIKYILNLLIFPAVLLVMLWIAFTLYKNGLITIPFPGLLFTKLIGVVVSIILLSQGFSLGKSILQNFCKVGKSDCSKLLRSDAAKLTSWLSWSEIGFFYFTGTFCAILLQPTLTYLLVWLNLLCLPYSIYSISYQYKTNKWCVLCSTVQILLWGEFLNAVALVLFWDFRAIHLLDFINLFFYLVLPIVVWSFLKPLLNYKAEAVGLKFQLQSFKNNPRLFNQALYNQARYAVPDNLKPIILGNADGEIVITVVSDPFCSPCLLAHSIAREWAIEEQNIKIKMLFHVVDDETDLGAKVASHILAINEKDPVLAEMALEEWYSGQIKDFNLLTEKYTAEKTLESLTVEQMQKDWCRVADITYTPTVFINGYKIPMPYKIEDAKYLLS